MKKIVLFFTALAVCLLSSCTTFEKSEFRNVLVKQDGKWGILHEDKVTIALSLGKRGYGWLSEGTTFSQGIECQYDSIVYRDKLGDKTFHFFIGYKGGQKYYLSTWRWPFADGQSVTDVSYHGTFFNRIGPLYKFVTEKGIYLQEPDGRHSFVGPYEDIYVGFNGYAVKQNGKWGFTQGEKLSVPAVYDDIIEVWDFAPKAIGYPHIARVEKVVLARKKGGSWVGFDMNGKAVNISVSALNHWLKTPSLDPKKYDPLQTLGFIKHCRRSGDDHLGVIFIYSN